MHSFNGRPGSISALTLGLLLLVGLLSSPAWGDSELTIQITRGTAAGIPVAIVPFAGMGPLPVDVASVVEADLARSGRFQTLPRKDMPQQPTTAAGIDASQWRILKTDYVTIGRLVPNGAGLAVEFEVVNVLTGQRLLGYSIPTTTETLRLAGHRVADMIYEKILGIPGAFATRIAYVSIEGPPKTRHWRLVVADADGENARVILDAPEPIMSPEAEYEWEGLYPHGVVFPTANVVKDGTLFVYYGCADKFIGVATADFDELVDYVLQFPA